MHLISAVFEMKDETRNVTLYLFDENNLLLEDKLLETSAHISHEPQEGSATYGNNCDIRCLHLT